ncbi:MAG: NAD(+) diphosphatase [Lachnospiraceae bacterium]|nr:NAD(+) diphosphatase [Lachnospiraceae bacterium]
MIQDIEPRQLYNQYYEGKPEEEDTCFFFKGNEILASAAEDGTLQYPRFSDFREEDRKKFHFVYLLRVDRRKCFLAVGRNLPEEEVFTIPEGFSYYPIYIFRKTKPKYMAFAAVTAWHLNMWYRNNQFCGRCGKRMTPDHKERMMHCSCGNMVYPRISPAVIVGITNGNKLLLTKYAYGEYKNYSMVAGFTEIGETLEQTVEREVMEEVGLKVKNIRYYKSQPWGLSGSLLAGFFCDLDGDDRITLQEDELKEAEWVEAGDIPPKGDGISLGQEMIQVFRKAHMGNEEE